MGAWSQLFEVFNPALSSLQTFLQAIAVLGAGCFAAYYKIREMFAGPQEDQMCIYRIDFRVYYSGVD